MKTTSKKLSVTKTTIKSMRNLTGRSGDKADRAMCPKTTCDAGQSGYTIVG